MNSASLVVVIPTFNEAPNVERLLPNLMALDVDVLVVDDGSSDGTQEVVAHFGSQFARVELLRRPIKMGLGSAYREGFTQVLSKNYEHVIQMDADGSHRAEDLCRMIAHIRAHPEIDLLIGSRWIKGGAVVDWPKRREILSRVANMYSRLLLGLRVKDNTAGFRIYRADFLRRMNLNSIKSEGYAFQIEMTCETRRMHGVIAELPILFVEREIGVSKMSSEIIREALIKVTKWGIARLFAR